MSRPKKLSDVLHAVDFRLLLDSRHGHRGDDLLHHGLDCYFGEFCDFISDSQAGAFVTQMITC